MIQLKFDSIHKVSVALLFIAFLQLNVINVNTITVVKKCPREKAVGDGSVSISDCESPPCKLKQGSQVSIDLKFTADEEVENIYNNVFAYVAGIPLPWIGQDGLKVCDKIYLPDGVTPVKCPLSAGQEYLYKNSFNILSIYPQISVKVHWALLNQKRKALTCFEVDARITA